jgi:hypothetical protein
VAQLRGRGLEVIIAPGDAGAGQPAAPLSGC